MLRHIDTCTSLISLLRPSRQVKVPLLIAIYASGGPLRQACATAHMDVSSQRTHLPPTSCIHPSPLPHLYTSLPICTDHPPSTHSFTLLQKHQVIARLATKHKKVKERPAPCRCSHAYPLPRGSAPCACLPGVIPPPHPVATSSVGAAWRSGVARSLSVLCAVRAACKPSWSHCITHLHFNWFACL